MQIESDSIILRDFIQEDLALYESYQMPGHKWQQFDAPYFQTTEDDVNLRIENLQKHLEANNFPNPRTRMVIADKATNKLIGTVNSYWESKETKWLAAGIGIYDESKWGQGVGFKALTLWISYLFQAHPEIVRLDLRTWSGNAGMMSLAKKLGFKEEARFRKARIVDGQYYDSVGFGTLREEWKV